jgi:DNA-binding transcriptional MerR regulator
MRIGDLSARTGVSVRSLRYYEEQGLLASSRSAGGHRYYSEDGVDRVAYLQRLYAAGLSSQTITSLLPCLESPSAATSDAAYDQLAEERDKLAAHIAGLTRTLESLNELIDANRAHRAASGTGQNRAVPDDPVRIAPARHDGHRNPSHALRSLPSRPFRPPDRLRGGEENRHRGPVRPSAATAMATLSGHRMSCAGPPGALSRVAQRGSIECPVSPEGAAMTSIRPASASGAVTAGLCVNSSAKTSSHRLVLLDPAISRPVWLLRRAACHGWDDLGRVVTAATVG